MQARAFTFEAIGTHWAIRVRTDMSDNDWRALQRAIRARIELFDKHYSRFRPDSLVTRMSHKAGSYTLPPDGYNMLHFYERLYRATHGKVTPLIGQTISAAGYDAHYSLKSKPLHHLQRPPAWEDALTFNRGQLTLKQPALLDFGAAGKGYLVDLVHELLRSAGAASHTINAGGDIRHYDAGNKTLAVGLENPTNTSEAIGIARIGNQSICASSGNRRAWGGFHHIIDPITLRSPCDIIATWVIADTAMQADGLATALFFAPPAQLKRHFSFEYAVLSSDMQLIRSRDFPATVYEEMPV